MRISAAILLCISGLTCSTGVMYAQHATGADNQIIAIPEWSGGITTPPADYAGPGSALVDPFESDQVLYTVNYANSHEHAEFLAPGWLALLQKYPDTFRMRVYRSRRSHSVPDWVRANSDHNANNATLNADGNGFSGAKPGVIFPQPDKALEAYWNHAARWRGQYIESSNADANVLANGNFVLIQRDLRVKFNFYTPEHTDDSDLLISLMARITAPSRQAGGGALVLEPIDQEANPRKAWVYDQGRRRVVRAPNLAFDAAASSSDGLRTIDDADIINGSPDRFEWELLGKRELLIPYNNYALAVAKTDPESLILAGHIDPETVRFELHRVWVIEATLKDGNRHIYAKRRFYLDEDSWTAVLAEQYQEDDALWRVSVAYTLNDYSLPGTVPTLYAFHDLQSGRYHIQGLNPSGQWPKTNLPIPDDSAFTPAALRRFLR